MVTPRIFVLGTGNRKKGLELSQFLALRGFELRTLEDFTDTVDVIENGDSFAANARLKATQQAHHLRHWVLGEDSGLSVDALDGAPGIFSSRFAGPNASDNENNRRLISELKGIPWERRTAHYVCHMTVSDPQGHVRAECEARCHGCIRYEPVGSAGFGYDPLFEVVEYHRTFGELGADVKSAISHRARAYRLLEPQLSQLLRNGSW